jgi:hypothetical protein
VTAEVVAAVGKQITAEEEEVVDEHLPSPCIFEPDDFTEIEGTKT